MAIEVCRTLRILQTHPEKNQVLGSMFKSAFREALLSVDSKSNEDVETLMHLTSEMRFQSIFNVG